MNVKIIVIVYIASICAANLLIAQFGVWVSPINAFVLIGLDLSLRDRLHDKWIGSNLTLKMGAMIFSAGFISWLINPSAGIIAVASAIAFSVSALCDTAIYQALIKKNYLFRSNASNAAGAATDSVIFPTIAFGVFIPEVIAVQFLTKVCGAGIWTLIFNKFKRMPK